MIQMTERAAVSRWLARYEAAWRTPGTADLARLFTPDATYLQSPYEPPVTGLDAIAQMWEREREGPDEVFTLATDILAVDGRSPWSGPRSATGIRPSRSTGTCGSSGSPVTAAAPGSRNGLTGPRNPTPNRTTRPRPQPPRTAANRSTTVAAVWSGGASQTAALKISTSTSPRYPADETAAEIGPKSMTPSPT